MLSLLKPVGTGEEEFLAGLLNSNKDILSVCQRMGLAASESTAELSRSSEDCSDQDVSLGKYVTDKEA